MKHFPAPQRPRHHGETFPCTATTRYTPPLPSWCNGRQQVQLRLLEQNVVDTIITQNSKHHDSLLMGYIPSSCETFSRTTTTTPHHGETFPCTATTRYTHALDVLVQRQAAGTAAASLYAKITTQQKREDDASSEAEWFFITGLKNLNLKHIIFMSQKPPFASSCDARQVQLLRQIF